MVCDCTSAQYATTHLMYILVLRDLLILLLKMLVVLCIILHLVIIVCFPS